MARTEVAEGVWCVECEFFEVQDDDGTRCLSCGCHVAHHRQAVVVAEDA